MAESTQKTVTEVVASASKNTVKITLEEYNELMRKASRPINTHVTYLQKTAQQAAMDSYTFGGFFAGLGAIMLVGGIIVAISGRKKLGQ